MAAHPSIDPGDWPSFRTQAHRMLDDALDYIAHIRERPVWQPIPGEVRGRFQDPVPHAPSDLAEVHGRFLNDILPYASGNTHPGFMGWVHGGGTPVGVLAEMLAASLNANLGRPRSYSDRSRASDCPLDAGTLQLSRERHRFVCDRRVDGESYRRADRPRCGIGFRGALRGCRRRYTQTDCLRLGRCSHLHCHERWISAGSAATRSV